MNTYAASQRVDPLAALRPLRSATWAATVSVIAQRTVLKSIRSPQLLLTSAVTSATFIVLFRYIFGGSIQMGTLAYVDFLIPGMVMTSVIFTGISSSIGVAEDLAGGFNDRLRSLPAPRLAILAGRAIGDTAIVTWSVAVTAAMGYAVGFRVHGSFGEAMLAFALCVVFGVAFVWVFITVGLVAGTAQAAQGMSMLAYPLVFISSAYIRIDTLPDWMEVIARYQPITLMCNAVRSLVVGDPQRIGLSHTTTYWTLLALGAAAALILVFAPLAVRAFDRTS
ncbi:ABC transporter permease [Kribbella sancticallisti]|uniref:Transport permease protein n=2 Tax=Kribbella sancticallisti TaxID=460087 RepID=A0ABN2DJP9_9ACTN